jgi:uncharacterized membrane protein YcjF (UPF0283 family)
MSYRRVWEPALGLWEWGQSWHTVNWFAFIVVPFVFVALVVVLVYGIVGTGVVAVINLAQRRTIRNDQHEQLMNRKEWER